MKSTLKLLFKLNLLHLPNLGALIYPEIPKHQAGAKLRNKVKEINGNRLTDNDWTLILSVLKGLGQKNNVT